MRETRHHPLPRFLMVAAILPLALAAAHADDAPKADKPAADPMVGSEAGQVRDDNGLKMKLVWCPPGFFDMQQVELTADSVPKRDREPILVRNVFLTHGYWIGRYEVTQAEWQHVMATEPWNGREHTRAGDEIPATFVTWVEAAGFCRRLTDRERGARRLPPTWGYTLPTEAQWERACRARTETRFSFGEDEALLEEHGWYEANALNCRGEEFAHRVGQKKPNPWGIYDMHGNVWEWCLDAFKGAGTMPGGRDPVVAGDASDVNTSRISRGGGWGQGLRIKILPQTACGW